MLDPWDNVAEFAFANLMIARDGRVMTPVANGTFLAGITRRRVLALLNEAGIEAVEAKLTVADLTTADEIFSDRQLRQGRAVQPLRGPDAECRPDRRGSAAALFRVGGAAGGLINPAINAGNLRVPAALVRNRASG